MWFINPKTLFSKVQYLKSYIFNFILPETFVVRRNKDEIIWWMIKNITEFLEHVIGHIRQQFRRKTLVQFIDVSSLSFIFTFFYTLEVKVLLQSCVLFIFLFITENTFHGQLKYWRKSINVGFIIIILIKCNGHKFLCIGITTLLVNSWIDFLTLPSFKPIILYIRQYLP